MPDYGTEALIRIITTALSVFTALALWPLLPRALAEDVRVLYSSVPIIYATGYSDLSHPLSHSKFLQKPYRPSQVLQAAADLGIKPSPAATN